MACLNNDGLVQALANPAPRPPLRFPSHPPCPCLARSLPPLSKLNELAAKAAREAKHHHILQESLGVALETPLDAHPAPPEQYGGERHETAALKSIRSRMGSTSKRDGGRYELSDVLMAIDKKDAMMLMEIRNQDLRLLLQPIGGVIPLVSAMRRGKSHADIQVLLTGAFSRKVNDITDDELALATPETKALLRSIRASLRIAISHGLATKDSSLLASFLQVIIMSDGDRWILDASHKVALALRAGPTGKPVASAQQMVEKWMSRELKKVEVASVGEYVANAVGDLVLLGLWSVVTDRVLDGEPIPLYYFARDDRITKALEERVDGLKRSGAYLHRLAAPLRKTIDTSLAILRKRNIGGRERIAELGKALDE